MESPMKRKVTPTRVEPVTKSIKIASEETKKGKLKSMNKAELIKHCEDLLSLNKNLIEENHKLINAKNENMITIQSLELSVKELKERCANTPVYLCEECDYLAECVHDFNDHTHSTEDLEALHDV